MKECHLPKWHYYIHPLQILQIKIITVNIYSLNPCWFYSYLMHIIYNTLDYQFYDLLRTEYHI